MEAIERLYPELLGGVGATGAGEVGLGAAGAGEVGLGAAAGPAGLGLLLAMLLSKYGPELPGSVVEERPERKLMPGTLASPTADKDNPFQQALRKKTNFSAPIIDTYSRMSPREIAQHIRRDAQREQDYVPGMGGKSRADVLSGIMDKMTAHYGNKTDALKAIRLAFGKNVNFDSVGPDFNARMPGQLPSEIDPEITALTSSPPGLLY